MEIQVVKYDEKRWTVEMSAYGFTYHLVPTESEEEAIINRDAIESFLTPCDGKESSDEMGDCNMPRVNGSAFDEDEIYYTECPNCGRSYDEIDADYCICSKCGWNANTHKFNRGSKRNPTELDYLNGDADLLTGEWS